MRQSFIIRIKDTVKISYPKSIRILKNQKSSVIKDFTCYLGSNTSKTEHRFRVVEFKDYNEKTIKVYTDLMNITPEKIANIYKEHWKVETFFRFIKQNLNVKNLFGTSENSVYNQLFIALITYVLIKFAYDEISKKFRCVKLSFNQFIRKLINSTLQDEIQVSIDLFLKNIN